MDAEESTIVAVGRYGIFCWVCGYICSERQKNSSKGTDTMRLVVYSTVRGLHDYSLDHTLASMQHALLSPYNYENAYRLDVCSSCVQCG